MYNINDLFAAMDEKYNSSTVGYITYGDVTGCAQEFIIDSRIDGMDMDEDDEDMDEEPHERLLLSVVLTEQRWVPIIELGTWSSDDEGFCDKVPFEDFSSQTTHKALCDWFDKLSITSDAHVKQRAHTLLGIYLQCAIDPLWQTAIASDNDEHDSSLGAN